MKHAYLNLILDLSLPVTDDPGTIFSLSRGITGALKLLESNPKQQLDVALSGAVTQALLRQGEDRPLQMLAEAAIRGQVNFLSTACYGAFLPLVPREEAQRQIALNDQVNREAVGAWVYRPEGLFPPQLGYSRTVAELSLAPGRLKRVVVDGIAYHGGHALPRNRSFVLRNRPGLYVFFADRGISQGIESGRVRGALDLLDLLPSRPAYVVARIPGRLLLEGGPGLRFLHTLAAQHQVISASLEDLLSLFPEFEAVEPVASALGTDPSELAAGIPYAKWFAPGNELHAILWRLVQLASEEASRLIPSRNPLMPEFLLPRANRRLALAEPASPELKRLRFALDVALDCAAWRFASGKPEFEPERVREGGFKLLEAIRFGGGSVEPEVLAEAEELYGRLEQRCRDLAAKSRRYAPETTGAEASAQL